MAKVLTGKEVSEAILSRASEQITKLKNEGICPKLAIVRMGEREDDVSYEKSAIKKCESLGIGARTCSLPSDTSQEELITLIQELNKDDNTHGVLIFRPLPGHISEEEVLQTLDPQKDVDGITPLSMAGVYRGSKDVFPPCTARACIEVLEHYGITLAGKNVAVIGRSLVVGRPVAMMAMKKDATVTICHTKTKNLETITKAADIVIAAAGVPKGMGEALFSENQVILDVGIHVTLEGSLCGDVDYSTVREKVYAITPVPGGIGGVTTAVLMSQVVEATLTQTRKNKE